MEMSNAAEAPTRRCGLDHGIDIGCFETRIGRCTVRAFLYPTGGALGVALIDADGQMQWVLSVNLPAAPRPGFGQFYAKTYSENEEVARRALASGLFTRTGMSIASGFVEVPVWTIGDAAALAPLYSE